MDLNVLQKELQNLFLEFKNTSEDEIKHLNFDLNYLMELEKVNFGFKKDDLVFISAGDFSRFYWCPMESYLSCKENELIKYFGYLKDKIEYTIKLNKLEKIPKTEQELIKIGMNLTLNEIFILLKRKEYYNNVSPEEIEIAKTKLKTETKQQIKGIYLEIIHAKKMPKIHWVKKYKNFIFTCAPDGIDEDYVYEFKSSKNSFFGDLNLNKAKLQADLYGICFNKKFKLIEQLILTTNKLNIIKEKINLNEVNRVILEFNNILKGKLPKSPKEEFKCKVCKYKNICKIKN